MIELESGETAIVPGSAAQSALVQRINEADESLRMPPPDSGKELPPRQRQVLTEWINSGANYEPHWAFVPPQRPVVPSEAADKTPHPIDALINAKLGTAKVQPTGRAAKEQLLRRVTFDLTGLPPTIEELDAFLADHDPDAFARVVARLLDSPHYGERMAVDWLDGARFADSNGYQNDYTRSMYPWRDWVIRAFNRHQPYDQFLIEQIAGDLLPGATEEQRIATGFNRNHRSVTEAGSIEEEWLVENVIDRTDTFGTVVLGLTVGCARCHDHKFDPLSQREYYQLFAFFNNAEEQGVYVEQRGNVGPKALAPTAEQDARLQEFDDKVQSIADQLDRRRDELANVRRAWLADLKRGQSRSERPLLVEAELSGDWRATQASSSIAIEPTADLPLPNGKRGALGRAAEFAGDSRLTYPTIHEPKGDVPFSVGVWVDPQGAGAIYSRMNVGQGFRGCDALLLDDGRLAVHLVHAWPSNAVKVITKEKLSRDKWTHLIVSYDGTRRAAGVAVYLDGELQELEVETDTLSASFESNEPLRIGTRSTEHPLHGVLRHFQIVDGATSPAQALRWLADALASCVPNQIDSDRDVEKLDQLMFAYCKDPVVTAAATLQRELDEAKQQRKKYEETIPASMVMEERSQRRTTYLLKRGHYSTPDTSEALPPAIPEFLGNQPADLPRNRLGLARWATSRENPLTARVMVNRLWHQFFGRGLVSTLDNLGLQAEPPLHRELLDWLAVELMESGWDIQHVQRLIISSEAYRRQSEAPQEAYRSDPENRLLARGPRYRLSAEMVRDNALTVSGLLARKIGGPSVMPYQPSGLWEELQGGAFETYTQGVGDDLYRRSLYTFRKRTVPHPSMATFDAPSWEICQVGRSTTNTPLQALALLNDVVYVEAARQFAERMIDAPMKSDEERIVWAFRSATSRSPTSSEIAKLKKCLEAYRATFRGRPTAAAEFVNHGASPRNENLDEVELAAHTALASVLLNLDEAITKN